ncbi:MAG TPA: DUF4838 domain-containing protein [Gemmatimonadaceae bacterium]|nr:DUF4838 domain-containing protein [Gemmatimonadaceae bacterium]
MTRLAPLLLLLATPLLAQPTRVELARGGRALVPIVLAHDAGETERFAAEELARYLGRMSGGRFTVVDESPLQGASIHLGVVDIDVASDDAYAIDGRDGSLQLVGESGRAVLYAAYDLLERLGVRWPAPALPYAGADSGRVVPRLPTLAYQHHAPVRAAPRFGLRKLDVEEGLSHDEASLRAIIAWMPTARYGVLQVPMDYGGAGRVRWDAWREALVPELRKRGILVEVGGHGYENFLHAGMEGGRLFERHPEWFGRDSTCKPSPAKHLVFDTEDTAAVAYLTRNVVAYLQARPEIGIFDFWPPDGARWAECGDWKARGTVEDRQARLVNHVRAAVAKVRPDVRFEIIAYAHAKNPPTAVALDPTILVDFCPIAQNFDVAIFDSTGSANRQYVEALRAWKRTFRGGVGHYSYYRKYAWRSLPVVIPRYMQRDLQWYAANGITASLSTYAEPGDWATYEVNHYVLGRLAWDPRLDVDSLLVDYVRARYGSGAPAALVALETLEATVRVYGSLPGTRPKPAADVAAGRARVERAAERVMETRRVIRDATAAPALERLSLMLDLAARDLAIVEAKARGEPIAPLVTRLVEFLTANAGKGVFLTRAGDEARYRRHYRRAE